MDKIKARLGNLPFKASFILYVTACLVIAAVLSSLAVNTADNARNRIYLSYGDAGVSYYLTTRDGERLGNGTVVLTSPVKLSDGDNRKVALLSFLSAIAIPVVFSACIVFAAVLFYKNKLKRPLSLLTEASAKIEANDLDFTLAYGKKDEMGRLCDSFEKMRAALQENSLAMWRQADERKRLNAAFSHDLRTPLTVLRGQSDMLLKYVPEGKISAEKIAAMVDTMKTHILRLENYVSTMNRLQKLEDIEIQKADIPAKELTDRLKSTGGFICTGLNLEFDEKAFTPDTLHVDLFLVMQVYENLLSNAIRFAGNKILVTLSSDKAFSVTVSDDGRGFSDKDLQEAAKPFYRSEGNESGQHFGIGLYICKTLCEKHGGYLRLFNNPEGGSVKAVF